MASPMNRRAFLRTAASASAVAAGAGAVTIAAAFEHPDAELLSLSPEIDRLYAEHLVAEAEYFEACKPVAAIVGPAPEAGSPGWAAWVDAASVQRLRHGVGEIAGRSDALYNAAHDVADLMIATPASTIEGLAAKAKALKFDLGMIGNGDPRDEWDGDKENTFAFLCEIERMAQAVRA